MTGANLLIGATGHEQTFSDLLLQRVRFFNQRVEALEEHGEILGGTGLSWPIAFTAAAEGVRL